MPKTPKQIIDKIGDQQGWNDESKLHLCLSWIEHITSAKNPPQDFKSFLEKIAKEESEEEYCQIG